MSYISAYGLTLIKKITIRGVVCMFVCVFINLITVLGSTKTNCSFQPDSLTKKKPSKSIDEINKYIENLFEGSKEYTQADIQEMIEEFFETGTQPLLAKKNPNEVNQVGVEIDSMSTKSAKETIKTSVNKQAKTNEIITSNVANNDSSIAEQSTNPSQEQAINENQTDPLREANKPNQNTTEKVKNNNQATTASKTVRSDEETKQVLNKQKYRRSSLYSLMINDPNRLMSSSISMAFEKNPIPEKFNDHNISERLIEGTANDKLQEVVISSFLEKNQIAKKLVAKWFNRSERGGFNMDLIAERGNYDATELDVKVAMSSKRGLSILADAGEELIKNTFVIVNDYKYVSKEEVAEKTKTGLKILGALASNVQGVDLAVSSTNTALTIAGKGYVIKTKTYLYRLDWNEEISSIFYNTLWTEDSNLDQERKNAFDNSTLFKLTLIGSEVAYADIQSSVFTQKTEEELIVKATVEATDKVITVLQRRFEEFKTKSPLYSIEPLAAKIGLKEGLEGGDKYEVLEQIQDENGKTFYNRVGIIKVDKKQIWDNRYVAGTDTTLSQGLTIFNGSGKFYPGMLIKQLR